MKQHIVKHKQNNKEYLLNTVELDRFFQFQDIENYTVKDKLTAQEILGNIIAFITVAIGSGSTTTCTSSRYGGSSPCPEVHG